MTTQGQPLLQTEAQARFRQIDVTSYDVRLDLSSAADESTFGSVTEVTFESRGGNTFIEVKPNRLVRVVFNDQTLSSDLLEHGRLPLETLEGTNRLVVEAVMPFRNDGEGLHRSTDPVDGNTYVYGMSFMDAAPTIFACFDQPDLKAPYTFHVRAPRAWTVIGNAPGEQVEPGVWEFEQTQPLSTYFVTLVAGPYHLIRDEHDGIPLSLSSRASLAGPLEADAQELFTLTKQCFDEFHRLFGIRYPFGNYHQAFVPEFNAGAMENPGCVTYRDQMLFDTRVTRGTRIGRATTVAHEMAHQWFGNITTPVWWDDLWLNESFAEYMGNRVTADVTEYDDAWTQVSWARRQWGLSADQRPSTHPVAGNGAVDAVAALQNFDGISYTKGSSILKQLATSLGDDVFFAGAVDHFTRNRFGNATMHDLFASWERSGAGDLSPVIDQWLRTAGPDRITLDRSNGTLVRTPPPEHPANRTHRFDVEVLGVGRTPVTIDGPVTPVSVDPVGPVILDPDETSWAVYVPNPLTVESLVEHLPRVEDHRLIAATWNNLKSGYSVAAIDPDDIVDLVVAAPPLADSEDTGRRTIPWLLREVLPAASEGSLERINAALMEALGTTDPGSEEQLTAFRASISTTCDAALLRGWRDGTDLPSGLDLDGDLRWRLTTALARSGAVDRADVDRLLASEETVTTRAHHARAVASMPTPEAKQFAWERFTGAVDVPNYELEAAGAGLWQDGQESLTDQYVARYIQELPATAEVRSGWVLALTAESFFPRTAATAEAVAALETLLEPDVLVPAVARRVADQLDDLRRRCLVRATFPH
ncbi:aminopeptidase N [Nocardioides salsibiostraticola]